MPLLFSYGTLQQESVQLSTFGRRLDGQRDVLTGFVRSQVMIEDPRVAAMLGMTHHANVTQTSDDATGVSGTALEVTDAELASADQYEAPFRYARVPALLASGRHAWVYVHAPVTSEGS
jgi:hypothetical protein